MITILAQRKDGKAEFFKGESYSQVESSAREWGATRFEDELGGIFVWLNSDGFVFLRQRKANEKR